MVYLQYKTLAELQGDPEQRDEPTLEERQRMAYQNSAPLPWPPSHSWDGCFLKREAP